MMTFTANIVTIGDEILLGTIIDTNSTWLAEILTKTGFSVQQKITVGDNLKAIINIFQESTQRVKLTVVTGGLGPTNDDITKKALLETFLLGEMEINDQVLENVERIAKMRHFEMNALNIQQAAIPKTTEPLYNKMGTAPGIYYLIPDNQNIIVLLPGVPHEMKHIVEEQLIPKLLLELKLQPFYHKTIFTYGLPESSLAKKIEMWENQIPSFLKLAYLPSATGVRLRLSQVEEINDNIQTIIEQQFSTLRNILNDVIIDLEGNDLISWIKNECVRKKVTVSVAESCSGGRLSALLTALSGSSEFFKGGIVAYSNEVKNRLLDVNDNHLIHYGAVSKVVVEQMAVNIRNKMNTDFGIAISGIAGPSADGSDKPVGLIWIAVADKKEVVAEKVNFNADREGNMLRASYYALNLLRKKLQTHID